MPQELSQATRDLLDRLTAEKEEGPPAENTISVSALTRGLGFFYEKIRNTLDYHEEHLWAKNAILRILKRRYISIHKGDKIGRTLIEELIRGRYLDNNSITESRALAVDQILEKYRLLIETFLGAPRVPEVKIMEMEEWLIRLAAAEIEAELLHHPDDRLYISYIYQVLKERLSPPAELHFPTPRDWQVQLYIACYRTFLEADHDMEAFTLWQLYFQEWKSPSDTFIRELAGELSQIRSRIEASLEWPARKYLDRLLKRRTVLLKLLRDIVEEHGEETRPVIEDPEKLESALKKYYEARYLATRLRLQRSAIRSVIFIFITKMVFAMAAEVPYEIWKTGDVNFWAIGINTVIPPLLLLGAAVAIRMPGEEKNFTNVVIDFNKMIAPASEATMLGELSLPKTRNFVKQTSLAFLYVLNFTLTFGILYWFFKLLKFNTVSAALFIFFLSLVSFFALRLRRTANELAAVEEKEHYIQTILDFILFPIVEIGRLLSRGLRAINIAAFIFDFLIEAPFQTFVEMLEDWMRFLRERKQTM